MLLGERTGLPNRPMSVEEIVNLADEQTFDAQYSIQHYFRTASLMVKQANIYEHEGNDQMAYFLLYRHAGLILSNLTKHPEAKDAKHRKAWTQARKDVNTSLAKLEVLKPRIGRRYQKYTDRVKAVEEKSQGKNPKDLKLAGQSLEEDMFGLSLGSDSEQNGNAHRASSPTRLDPTKHQDMAVDHANREIQRRLGKLRKRNVSQHQDNGGLDDNMSMINARHEMERSEKDYVSSRTSDQRPSKVISYRYPTVPQKQQQQHDNLKPQSQGELQLPTFTSIRKQSHTSQPPQPPPKNLPSPVVLTHSSSAASTFPAPPIPSKTDLLSSPPLSPQPNHQFLASASLENGQPLRTMFLPKQLRHDFLGVAEPNTAARLETCGILCGTLIRNAFFISKLVIPEQTSTSDTCEMINEEALYGYIDAQPEDLMVLGWIHTHPTQTCFMSSKDLHTHVWYQVSLAESIAIVCSPSKSQPDDWGIFRLTDPPGVDAVKTCSKPGFHSHSESRLYTDVLGRPGHVLEHEQLRFDVVDLRP